MGIRDTGRMGKVGKGEGVEGERRCKDEERMVQRYCIMKGWGIEAGWKGE
jgi:hypothetical protein